MTLSWKEERLLLMLQDQEKQDQGLTIEEGVPEETIGDQEERVVVNF